jgi:DNA polymerase III delta prime subunit
MHISHNERYISIDEVRDIRRDIKLTPFESERRFLLIKDVDRMRHEAQNSLLKTLEEPPPSLIIVLTTARPHLLFKTIISRVMPLQLSPPPLEDTVKYLSQKYDVDPDYTDALYNYFMGNLKKIEEFLTDKKNRDDDTGFEYINSGIDVELEEIEKVLNKRGKTDRNIILELLDDLLLRLRAMRDRLGFERFEGMAEEVITAKERISANVNINGTLTYLVESLKKASVK